MSRSNRQKGGTLNSPSGLYIERVQVDEGFLDGLDLQLGRGLTVVIGARGAGKTSLVELVRFCLGAGSFTDEARERGISAGPLST